MSKTILAVWNAGSKGKSATLREFAIVLLDRYKGYNLIHPDVLDIPHDKDFRLIVEINGVIVGIETQGDPGTGLKKRLKILAEKYKCDIVLCSTRTRGETIKAVDDISNEFDYQTIWTSTYQIGNKDVHTLVNNLKGQHILELLQRLSLI